MSLLLICICIFYFTVTFIVYHTIRRHFSFGYYTDPVGNALLFLVVFCWLVLTVSTVWSLTVVPGVNSQ